MRFDSLPFFIFAAVFFVLWPWMRKRSTRRWGWIVGMSLVFYGWAEPRFVLLFVGSGLINYGLALAMERWPTHRRAALLSALAWNLGCLVAFKYLDFLLRDFVNPLLARASIPAHVTLLHWVLPLGISFYTFEAIAYVVDVHRGALKPTRNVLHFFSFLSLFPHLIAGPIVPPGDFLPQLERENKATDEQLWDGLKLIAFGFFRKTVIADNLGVVVNYAFDDTATVHGALYWWTTLTLFAVQLYCDFSAYSDIARGVAKWMGLELMVNFDFPYLSKSFGELWRRWHISLTTWILYYVYLPLGTKGTDKKSHHYVWICITFLLAGIWHGAGWKFVWYGAANAFILCAERFLKWPERLKRIWAGEVVSWAITFVLWLLVLIFFRAPDLHGAWSVFGQLVRLDVPSALPSGPFPAMSNLWPWLIGIVVVQHAWHAAKTRLPWPPVFSRLEPVGFAVLIVAAVFLRGRSLEFIYFQF